MFHGDVQEHNKVREQPLGGDVVGGFDEVEGETPAVALVGDGGVEEAVADNGSLSFQCGADHRGDELGSGGIKQQKLGEGVNIHLVVRPIPLEPVPDLVAQRDAPGLVCEQCRDAYARKALVKRPRLGGLTRTLPTFKGDE